MRATILNLPSTDSISKAHRSVLSNEKNDEKNDEQQQGENALKSKF